MVDARREILNRLQRDILPLQGLKHTPGTIKKTIGVAPVEQSFPNQTFPLGCIHEFLISSIEDAAATSGFIAALLSKLIAKNGVCIWISASRMVYPPALKAFGLAPENFIFIDLKDEKEVLWAMLEALKCERVNAVLGELRELSFTESRRFQLAVEQSRVTGFILRKQPRIANTIASVSQWRITSLASEFYEDMPGVGFPCWQAELIKVRNGKPGKWKIAWFADELKIIEEAVETAYELQRKTG